MLILGAQVLIGFGFQAAFQPGFQRLPPPTQELKLVGLALMLGALGLLMAPGAFHQIAEGGNDSPRLIQFTGRVWGEARLLTIAHAYQQATDWHRRRPPAP